MKFTFLAIGVLVLSLFVVSCFPKFTRNWEESQQQLAIVREIAKKISPHQLVITYLDEDSSNELVQSFVLCCVTTRPAFTNSVEAKQFLEEVLQIMLDTIEEPKNRVLLNEYPIDRKDVCIRIYFYDEVTHLPPPGPPYYTRIGWDGKKFYFDYNTFIGVDSRYDNRKIYN